SPAAGSTCPPRRTCSSCTSWGPEAAQREQGEQAEDDGEPEGAQAGEDGSGDGVGPVEAARRGDEEEGHRGLGDDQPAGQEGERAGERGGGVDEGGQAEGDLGAGEAPDDEGEAE